MIYFKEVYFQCLHINDFSIDATAILCVDLYAVYLKLILSFQVLKQTG